MPGMSGRSDGATAQRQNGLIAATLYAMRSANAALLRGHRFGEVLSAVPVRLVAHRPVAHVDGRRVRVSVVGVVAGHGDLRGLDANEEVAAFGRDLLSLGPAVEDERDDDRDLKRADSGQVRHSP